MNELDIDNKRYYVSELETNYTTNKLNDFITSVKLLKNNKNKIVDMTYEVDFKNKKIKFLFLSENKFEEKYLEKIFLSKTSKKINNIFTINSIKITNKQLTLKELEILKNKIRLNDFKRVEKFSINIIQDYLVDLYKDYGLLKQKDKFEDLKRIMYSNNNDFAIEYLNYNGTIEKEEQGRQLISNTLLDEICLLHSRFDEQISTKTLREKVVTKGDNKKFMGDYCVFSKIQDNLLIHQNITYFDIKNYENIPYSNNLFSNLVNYKKEFENFSKTSEPNINLLEIFEVEYFTKFLTLKYNISDNDVETVLKLVNTLKENIINLSKENIDKKIEFTIENKNLKNIFIYEIIKLYELGYSTNLLELSNYELDKSLINITWDYAQIKKIDFERIKKELFNNSEIEIESKNNYVYINIMSNNKIIYSISFRPYNFENSQIVGNVSIINNDYLITKKTYDVEDINSLFENNRKIFFPKNYIEEIIVLIKSQKIQNIELVNIFEQYISNNFRKLQRILKTSLLMEEINTMEGGLDNDNNFKTKKFREFLLDRLLKDNNSHFEEKLKQNGFKRVKINNKTFIQKISDGDNTTTQSSLR